MVVSVVQIGNSRGIRLPKALLDQLAITDKVDLAVENSRIVLTPVARQPREGWETEFQAMAAKGEDVLLLPEEVAEKGFEWEW